MYLHQPINSLPGIAGLLLIVFAAVLGGCSSDAGPQKLAFTSTVAGTKGEFGETFGIAWREGLTYVSDGENGELKIVRDGAVTTFATGLNTPSGIAFTKDGTLIVADAGSHTIKSIKPDGAVSIFAGIENKPGSADGDATAAQFRAPVGVAVDDKGRVFVADTYNDRIRLIEGSRVSTFAGGARGDADGAAADARFDTPVGIAVWHDKLLVADTGNRKLRVVEPDGRVWTLAGSGADGAQDGLLSAASFVAPTGVAISPGDDGRIYIADGNAIRTISGIVPVLRTLSAEGRGFRDGPARRSHFNRPSGLAITENGEVLIADSENRLVRKLSSSESPPMSTEEINFLRGTPQQFKTLQPPRWPYDPPEAKRDIAGTLGELRGQIKQGDDNIHFHNGLDIAGAYGETARFVRSEKVLGPIATDNFGTLRELIRMPTMGYIHVRLGRDANGKTFGDDRFLFDRDQGGKLTDIRVPRGSYFKAGEPIGTLNAMNHVHLVAGRGGSEMNAIDALIFPGISDSRPPIIEGVTLADQQWRPLSDGKTKEAIRVSDSLRMIMRAYDQVDGNSDRRRLGLYKAGYQILNKDGAPVTDEQWTILFDRLPPPQAVPFVYAQGSRSGATGETIFNYIVSNRVEGDNYAEGTIDTSTLAAGEYIIRAFAADYFGNISHSDLHVVR